jgi:hypothetical protein
MSLPHADVLRKCVLRAKLEVVLTLLRGLKKELHVEKPGERELQGEIDFVRDRLQKASTELLSLRTALRELKVKTPPLVNPCCSNNVRYPLTTRSGYECGHCGAFFEELVPGCPLDELGQHDENWKNDGMCACGADGSEKG